MISVITPFKDSEDWLGRCLESMHSQKGNFQFVIVNDHSKDGGRKIAEEYAAKDERFTVLDNIHAPGVSGARNTGIEAAEGEWITFLDADDMLAKEAWETFEAAAAIGANIVQMNHWRYYTKIDKLARKYTNRPGKYSTRKLPKMWCMVWNKLFRRDFLEGIRFREGMQYGEDELFIMECLAKENRIRHLEECAIVHCFDNKGSLSRSKTERELFDQAHAIEEFLQRQEDPEIRCAACRLLGEHWASETYLTIIGRA